ncbi:hypothetical protein ABT263_38315 [Kitasatospora sp. NPDC001603]|uniref:hypothetical protein n=1 Tax=Kitasatospora sp. NPDC001603 TaxID=3154388 RepID=UPI00331C1F9A
MKDTRSAAAAAGTVRSPETGTQVCVDTTLIALATSVLDHCPVPAPATSCADLTGRLREAIGADSRHPHPRPQGTRPEHAEGRLERDQLATAINRFLDPQRRGPLRQLDAALVHEAVQALRTANTSWAGEPLGTAARLLWEHLYLCIPLTAIVASGACTGRS